MEDAGAQKKAAAGDGAAPKTMITVKSGARSIPFAGGGKTIADVRGSLSKVLNLGADGADRSIAYMNEVLIDAKDEGATQIPEGAVLEFVKEAGRKGLGRKLV